jgi:hypothetical protein
MPSPRAKHTAKTTYQRILDAIEEIASDDQAQPTKREIERRAGLSHDAVARAFRQDAGEDNEFKINQRLGLLTEGLSSARVSPDRDKQISIEKENRELKDRVRHLNAQMDLHAMAVLAFHLRDAHIDEADTGGFENVVPIRRRRGD